VAAVAEPHAAQPSLGHSPAVQKQAGYTKLNFIEEGLLEYCFSKGVQWFESMPLPKQETIKQAAEQNWSTYVDGTGPVPGHRPSPKIGSNP
jgi:hypothetical protein